MTDALPGRPGGRNNGPHLILYDGTCGFCHESIQIILRLDRHGVFHYAPLQGPTSAALLAQHQRPTVPLTTVYVVSNYLSPFGDQQCLSKSRAAVFIGTQLGWPWKMAGAFRLLPAAWLDAAYDLFARHRYKFFGRRAQCVLPDPSVRHRFIDSDQTLVKPGGVMA